VVVVVVGVVEVVVEIERTPEIVDVAVVEVGIVAVGVVFAGIVVAGVGIVAVGVGQAVFWGQS